MSQSFLIYRFQEPVPECAVHFHARAQDSVRLRIPCFFFPESLLFFICAVLRHLRTGLFFCFFSRHHHDAVAAAQADGEETADAVRHRRRFQRRQDDGGRFRFLGNPRTRVSS